MIKTLEGNSELSKEYFTAAEALAKEEDVLTRSIIEMRALSAMLQGNFAKAKYYSEQNLDDARRMRTMGVPKYLFRVGQAAVAMGNYAEALPMFMESLAMYQERGDPYDAARLMSELGNAQRGLGAYDEARAYFREAIISARDLGAVPIILSAIIGQAQLLAVTGQRQRALSLMGLVLHHPAADLELRFSARRIAAALQADSNADGDALAHGKSLDLETIAAEIAA
jgi:tetratricopeptide (TPR) repeat protein